MPGLSFSRFKEKLENHTKCQTIRLPRKPLSNGKPAIKVGDKLYIYWLQRTPQRKKLGEGICMNIVRKNPASMTQEDARLDGFEDGVCSFLKDPRWAGQSAFAHVNLARALREMHPKTNEFTEFDIISWRWIWEMKQ